MNLIQKLEETSACTPAVDWIKENNFQSPQEAWGACERGDWMLWAIQKFDLCDLRTLTLAKARTINQVGHMIQSRRSASVLLAAFDFARGGISEEEVSMLAKTAYNPASNIDYGVYAAASPPAPADSAAIYAAKVAEKTAFLNPGDTDPGIAAQNAGYRVLLESANICRELLPIINL